MIKDLDRPKLCRPTANRRLDGPPSGSHPVRRPDDKRKRLGPYSPAIDRGALGIAIDGRSREGQFILTYQRLLFAHIGGEPSITQKLLIARVARIALHLELLDENLFKRGKGLTQHDFQHYCAWSNALARMAISLPGCDPDPFRASGAR